jgi:protein phosphatase
LSVRVQCPQCRTVCQVEEQFLGKRVQCGKCNQAFQAVAEPAPAVAAATPQLAPVPAPAAPASSPLKEAGAALGGLWSGLRGIYQSMTVKQPAPGPGSSGEIFIELDGPAAAALSEPEKAARAARPGEVAPLPGVCRLDVGAATSAGCVRPRNEDSFLTQHLAWSNLEKRREAALVIVADGMGGYEAGDQASGMVIRLAGSALVGLLADCLLDKPADGAAARIDQALKTANKAVHNKGLADPGCKGMGATAAVVFVVDSQAFVGHVGDCRVYHFRAGTLTQVTRDQTLVARMVELGKLSEKEALTHPNRNEVSQAVGRHPDLQPAAYQLKVAPGDWLLVACDGLHAHLDANRVAQALREAPASAVAAAHYLVDLTNEAGGTDNTTVVAVRCY